MSSSKQKKEDTSPKKVETLNQPTSHSDGVNIGVRTDGNVFFQFFSETPEKAIECHRTMMRKESAIRLLDILAGALDYYPKKPSE